MRTLALAALLLLTACPLTAGADKTGEELDAEAAAKVVPAAVDPNAGQTHTPVVNPNNPNARSTPGVTVRH